MRILKIFIFIIIIAAIAIPAQAFTFNSLSAEVSENGDTLVVFDYTMTFWEYFGYYTKIADPSDEIRKELDKRSSQPVDILGVSDKSASFLIYGFTDVKDNKDSKTYTVPPVEFSRAEEVLKDHWVSKITTFDLSPATTKIVFPDGYTKEYYNQADIPATVHTI